MTLRIILLVVLTFLIVRGLRLLMRGALTAGGGEGSAGKASPLKLVRDPVCGTHVAPRSALSLAAGGTTHYFCSEECRTKYRARM